MHVTKCDKCKKEITDRDRRITAGVGWSTVELCEKCGGPIVAFLKKLKLLEKMWVRKCLKNKKMPRDFSSSEIPRGSLFRAGQLTMTRFGSPDSWKCRSQFPTIPTSDRDYQGDQTTLVSAPRGLGSDGRSADRRIRRWGQWRRGIHSHQERVPGWRF